VAKKKLLGELLIEKKAIHRDQLEEAINSQVVFGGRLGTNLIELGYLKEQSLGKFLAEKHGVPYIPPDKLTRIDPKTIKAVPKNIAIKHKVIPIKVEDKKIHLIMLDPSDFQAIDEIGFALNRVIKPYVIPEIRLLALLEKFYGLKRDLRYITLSRADTEEFLKGRKEEAPPPVPEMHRAPAAPSSKPKAGPATKDVFELPKGEDLMPEEEFEKIAISTQKPPATPPQEEVLELSDEAEEVELVPIKEEAPKPVPIREEPREPTPIREEHPQPVPIQEEAQQPVPVQEEPPQPVTYQEEAQQPVSTQEEIQQPVPSVQLDEGDMLDSAILQELEKSLVSGKLPTMAPAQELPAEGHEVEQEPEQEVEQEPLTALSFDEATNKLNTALSRDDIASAVIGLALSRFQRAILFTVQRGLIIGWDGHGQDLEKGIAGNLAIPLTLPSSFKLVYDTNSFFLGSFPSTPVNDGFLKAISPKGKPRSSILIPILFKGKIVNILYGDNGLEDAPSDIGELLILAQKIPLAFEKLVQKRKEMAS